MKTNLRQFTHLMQDCERPVYREHFPELVPLLGGGKDNGRMFEGMISHELGHACELYARGLKDRVIQPNFGWPLGQLGWSAKTFETELKVCAYQFLIEQFLQVKGDSIISPKSVLDLAGTKRFWRKPEEHDTWALKDANRGELLAEKTTDLLYDFKGMFKEMMDFIIGSGVLVRPY